MDPLMPIALRALHDMLADPSVAGGSARMGEYMRCARRVLARARAESETIPAIADDRLATWQGLVAEAGAATTVPGLPAAAEALRHVTASRMAAGGDPTGDRWFAATVAALADYIEAVETGLPTGIAPDAPDGGDPDAMRTRLAAYLQARFPALPAQAVTSIEIIPGGRAKETARFALVANDILPTRLILRRDFDRDTTGTRSSSEFPLLAAVHRAGIPVPRPILAEEDASILGGSFMIVEEVTGARQMGELFPELNDFSRVQPDFGAALTAAAARLHAIGDSSLVAAMGGHHSAATPHEAVRSFHGMWQSIPAPPFALATELGFAWLLATPLPGNRPRSIVHGDLGAHNFMVRDGHLAAILDWELAHIGDPAEDIGYMRATIIDPLIGWDRFTRLYAESGGSADACDPRVVDWFSIWAHVRNSVYVAMFRNWVATGERTDIESVNAGWDFFARTQRYIARELAVAVARH